MACPQRYEDTHRRIPYIITQVASEFHAAPADVLICKANTSGVRRKNKKNTQKKFAVLLLEISQGTFQTGANTLITPFFESSLGFPLPVFPAVRQPESAAQRPTMCWLFFSLIKSELGEEACSISCFIYGEDVSAPLVFSSGFLIFFH